MCVCVCVHIVCISSLLHVDYQFNFGGVKSSEVYIEWTYGTINSSGSQTWFWQGYSNGFLSSKPF